MLIIFVQLFLFLPIVKLRVPLVEQNLLTRPEHLCSFPIISGVRFAQCLVFCVVYWESSFVFSSFFFWPVYCLSFGFRLLYPFDIF